MKILFIKTAIGFVITLVGFWIGGMYFADMRNASPLLLAISISCIIVGVYLLYMAGTNQRHGVQPPTIQNSLTATKGRSLFRQHREMSASYTKTSEMRDKLRMIKKIG